MKGTRRFGFEASLVSYADLFPVVGNLNQLRPGELSVQIGCLHLYSISCFDSANAQQARKQHQRISSGIQWPVMEVLSLHSHFPRIRSAALLGILVLSCSFSRSLSREGSLKKPFSTRPVVGAIRWDAWIGPVPGYDVGLQVERSLGPQRWHTRLPFFAEEVSSTEVRIRANTQAIMDQEIAYAHRARLDYWAFVMYPRDNPQTHGGIDLYLSSLHKSDVNFAMIVQSYTF